MMDVVKIGKAKPDEEVIKGLEALLQQAKSGHLRAFYCVATLASEEAVWATAGSADRFTALGCMARAIYRFNKSIDEHSEDWVPDDVEEL